MNHQSGSSSFQALFELALQDYETQTGTPLASHPLAQQFQNCQSVESVTALLQEQAQAFSKFRENDKIFKSLKGVVSALSKVSDTAALGHAIGMSFPPTNAIHTGLGILLAAFKGVGADLDALVDLLESVEAFLRRLDIYTKVPPTPAMTEIVGKIMVELLSTLALVTKQIRQGRPKKFVKKLFGENDVEAVLQRLDRLTQDEARTTAAQTLEVVYGLVRDMRVVLDDGKASADSVREALEIIQQIASDMNKSKRDKLHEDVRRWLSPPDPWKNHNLALGSRHTGTASWFVASSALSKWKLSGPRSLMWIHGKPGAGKSVFCSTIIDNIDTMTKSGLASLAFFYCDFREDEKRDLRGLLSSVLIQLCHQSDSYSRILSRFYSQHANGSKHPSDDELVRCLKDILGVPGQATVYLVIDGLDECSNTSAMPSPREKVLILLKDLIESRLPNLRICVTSRPEIDIQAALEPLTSHSISLHDERGQMEDIENYIKFVVNTDLNMRRWKTADKEQVIKVLIEKSDRMFRWVYCQIVYLRHCLPGRIRHALDELPETLDETYERALRDINKANWESAHRLLQCVAVAFRPLRVTELAEILSFDFKTGPIPKFDGDLRPEDPVEAVLSTTSSLLAIVDVEGSPVIQFSHYSVKEFLTSSRLAETNDIISRHYHVSMTPAHTLAAQACLSILLHLDTNVVSTDSLEKYPLAKYAAEYWVDHARFKGVSGNVEDGMKRLFDPSKKHLAIWVWIHDPILLRKPTRRTETLWWTRNVQAELGWQPRDSSLHYAAHCGLQVIVKFLIIQHSQDVDSRCFDSKLSPLHLASRQGHGDVALVLLEHGADLTAQTDDGSTPLHVASKEGCENAVRSLLEHGADVTARTNDGSTPLRETCNVDVARLLLEHGADATARSNDGSTPLHAASNVEVARSLLEHGADATARSNDGSTPLHGYSLHGNSNVEVARLLLEHGADATARSSNGSTSLHRTWDVEVARLLLKHGADATARSNDGSTPLHAASNVEVARLLLEHGADATARSNDGLTPLHRKSGVEVARLLLEHGADATARSNDGLTPLHGTRTILLNGPLPEHGTRRTARTKHGSILVHLPWNVEVARLLLEHGADATARANDGLTPLHWAWDVEVARLLLEHGADATAPAVDGSTPLHSVSGVEVARLLLEHGGDVTAQRNDGSTLLHSASRFGYEKVVCFLFELGVDATAVDKDGLTALHLASRWGHVEIAQLLLDHGADATAVDKHGLTALHWASYWGHVEIARLLLDHGADATARYNYGATPLYMASQAGHAEVIHLLVQHGAEGEPVRQPRTGTVVFVVMVIAWGIWSFSRRSRPS